MSEEEYAIKYAEERRMRMALENRLMGLIYSLIPYSGESFGLVFGVLEKNTDTIAESLKGIVQWQSTIETNVLLNLMKPAGKFKGISEFDLRRCNSLNDVSEKELTRMEHGAKHHHQATQAEWDKLAASNGFASVEEYADSHKALVAEVIMKSMMGGVSKEDSIN